MTAHEGDEPGSPEMDGRTQWRAVFRTPFRHLFFANATSSLGDWIGVAAILALTEQMLGTTRIAALGTAAVMMARFLPTMLLGPVAGVFVDRWDRRRVLVATDIGRGLVMALIPFAPNLSALLLATVVVEVQSTLFMPAKDALLPQLAGRRLLVPANQLNLIAAYGTLPLGGALFALSVAASGALFDAPFLAERPAAVAIWINAATFFLSAWLVTRIPEVPDREPRPTRADLEGPGAWEELKEGFRFIGGQPLVRGLVIGVMAAFVAAGVVIAIGQLFAAILNAGDSGFGVLIAVVGSGLVLGILAVGPLSRRATTEQLFAPGVAVAGVALAITALMPRLDMASVPAFVMGLGAGVAFLSGYTILQARTAENIRGRTFAAFNTGVRTALFAAMVLGPLLVFVIGPEAQGLLPEDGALLNEGQVEPEKLSGTVAYAIGGVRITLMVAGVIAIAGAIYSGRSVQRVLSQAEDPAGRSTPGEPRPAESMVVTVVGSDASTRALHMRHLRSALERDGHTVVTTTTPWGTPTGARIRDVLTGPQSPTGFSDRMRLLLYAAAVVQHREQVLAPALREGHVVVCEHDQNMLGWVDIPAPVSRLVPTVAHPHLLIDMSPAERDTPTLEAPAHSHHTTPSDHDQPELLFSSLETQRLTVDPRQPIEQVTQQIIDSVAVRIGPNHKS